MAKRTEDLTKIETRGLETEASRSRRTECQDFGCSYARESDQEQK